MTPEKAQALIDGIDYGNKRDMWGTFLDRYDPYTVYELAELVAGLRYEYAVAGVDADEKTIPPKTWLPNRYEANIAAMCVNTVETRVMRRLVSEPEVVS